MSISLALFDRFEGRSDLFPLVATRPIGNLRVGAFTLDQKWALLFDTDVSFITEDYLSEKFPLRSSTEKLLVIKATILPNAKLVETLKQLHLGERLLNQEGEWIAFLTSSAAAEQIILDSTDGNYIDVNYKEEYDVLKYPEDIFRFNARQIEFDIANLNFKSKSILDEDIRIIGNKCKIAQSAQLSNCTLNTLEGSILVDEGAVVEEGSVIYGPTVIGKHARVKAGTIIYPNVTIGDNTTVCGELNNTVIWGNSSKGHYGYLGCAVIGEGCNLGAGTTNSNLKNDWNTVKVYSYTHNNFRNTGLLKCGVFIGDHSMLAISSKINTGTVIGVGAQVALSDFIPKFVPDFSWSTATKSESYIFTSFVEMMKRKADIKKESFTEADKEILEYIYKKTEQLRIY